MDIFSDAHAGSDHKIKGILSKINIHIRGELYRVRTLHNS